MSSKYQRLLFYILVYALFVMIVAMIRSAWLFTTDDAYITLRYAHHWYFHGKLLWNLNDSPIEGYSNFLYVVFGVIAYALHITPIFFLKLIGLVSILASVFLTYQLARFWLSPLISLLPVFFMASNIGFYYWGVSGLETVLFEALFLAGIFTFIKGGVTHYPNEPVSFFYLIPSLLFALFGALARFDGLIIIFTIFLICVFYLYKTPNKKNFILLLSYFGIFIILYTPYFIWRLHYFGSLIPNSYACKLFSFNKIHVQTGWMIFNEFWNYYQIFYIFSLLFLIVKFDARALGLFFGSTVYILLFYNTDKTLAYNQHYFLPTIPVFLIFGVSGLIHCIDIITDKKYEKLFLTAFLVLLVIIFLSVIYKKSEELRQQSFLMGYRMFVREKVAEYLNEKIKPNQTVLIGDSGIIPFMMPESHMIDMFCLNSSLEKTVCKNTKNYAECLVNYYFSLAPDFIVINSIANQKYLPQNYYTNSFVAHDDRLLKNYKFIKKFDVIRQGFNYYIFERK